MLAVANYYYHNEYIIIPGYLSYYVAILDMHDVLMISYLFICMHLYIGEGESFDYTLGDSLVDALFESSEPDELVIIFHVDGVALEPNETLALELVPSPGTILPSGLGAFFIDVINITIFDNDSKYTYT